MLGVSPDGKYVVSGNGDNMYVISMNNLFQILKIILV
jgi:hypothetical protein